MGEKEIKDILVNTKLFAIDIDGTILGKGDECSPETVEAIESLANKGYIIAISTGRPYQGIIGEVLPIRGISFVISSDGADLTEVATGGNLWSKLIPYKTAADFVDEMLVPGNRIYLQHEYEGERYVSAEPDPGCSIIYELFGDAYNEEGMLKEGLGDLIRAEGQDVCKIDMWFSRTDGYEYYKNLISREYPKINIFRADEYELEFTSSETDKGKALHKLREYLDLGPNEICAIGDSGNDISMFREADVSIAMGNASDDVKDQSDYVIGKCTENGLAAFLEEYFL